MISLPLVCHTTITRYPSTAERHWLLYYILRLHPTAHVVYTSMCGALCGVFANDCAAQGRTIPKVQMDDRFFIVGSPKKGYALKVQNWRLAIARFRRGLRQHSECAIYTILHITYNTFYLFRRRWVRVCSVLENCAQVQRKNIKAVFFSIHPKYCYILLVYTASVECASEVLLVVL